MWQKVSVVIMKKFYNTPAVLIKEYEISETITTSNIAGGDLDNRDDGFEDMSGGPV